MANEVKRIASLVDGRICPWYCVEDPIPEKFVVIPDALWARHQSGEITDGKVLAKMALMRPIGSPASDHEASAFERELLDAVNATGIGAAALGGATTALAVHVNTAPCHIAALPLAINMGCSAMRRGTYEL